MRFPILLLPTMGLVSAAQLFTRSEALNQQKDLNLTATANFPSALSLLGIKLVNREPMKVDLSLKNDEAKPVTLQLVGGSLWDAAAGKSVKNLTSIKVGEVVNAGTKIHVPYTIKVDVIEADLLLNLAMVVTTETGDLVTVSAFNRTVSVVDPPVSVFDLQMVFLYLLLASGCIGALYAVYGKWMESVTPKREKRARRVKSQVVRETVTTTSTGNTVFDESWIPEHHLKKQDGKKVAPRARSRRA